MDSSQYISFGFYGDLWVFGEGACFVFGFGFGVFLVVLLYLCLVCWLVYLVLVLGLGFLGNVDKQLF